MLAFDESLARPEVPDSRLEECEKRWELMISSPSCTKLADACRRISSARAARPSPPTRILAAWYAIEIGLPLGLRSRPSSSGLAFGFLSL